MRSRARGGRRPTWRGEKARREREREVERDQVLCDVYNTVHIQRNYNTSNMGYIGTNWMPIKENY